jgi:hypothetical protein
MGRTRTQGRMSQTGGKLTFGMSDNACMGRVTITLALCVFPALIGCGKPEQSGVRLVKAHGPSDCHLTLNGVRIPDDVLVAEGKKHRGKRAAANDESDRCEGAAIMLRRAGMNTDELPSIDLRS